MTHLLQDILRQPAELGRTLRFLTGPGFQALEAASAAMSRARHLYLTGIGSSWHAALGAGALCRALGRPVDLVDAAELLLGGSIPPDSAMVLISRSGRSVEIVRLAAAAKLSRATVIGITNSPDGPLAREADIPIVVPVALDHAISINTYSTLAEAAGILACQFCGSLGDPLVRELGASIAEAGRAIPKWQSQLEQSDWLQPGAVTYFLGRGSSLGSALEARLLWEEGAKSPATAMGSSAFRHGPQEMIRKGCRLGIWMDGARMRVEDLAMARDLRQLGAAVMLVGQNLPGQAGDLVFELPAIPAGWQFLLDTIPVQLAAEKLSRLSGVDCDRFRLCTFIVEDDGGLLPGPKSGERT